MDDNIEPISFYAQNADNFAFALLWLDGIINQYINGSCHGFKVSFLYITGIMKKVKDWLPWLSFGVPPALGFTGALNLYDVIV